MDFDENLTEIFTSAVAGGPVIPPSEFNWRGIWNCLLILFSVFKFISFAPLRRKKILYHVTDLSWNIHFHTVFSSRYFWVIYFEKYKKKETY